MPGAAAYIIQGPVQLVSNDPSLPALSILGHGQLLTMQGDFSNLEFVVANDGSLVIHGDVTVTGTLTVSGADTGPTSQVVEVDFGHSREDGVVIKTVSAPWILADSTVEVVVRAVTTADHDPEDVAVEALSCYASNIIPGVGFDVYCSAPNSTWGRYSLLATG